jgi:hypothetical protein
MQSDQALSGAGAETRRMETNSEHLSRPEAIALLRRKLATMVDDSHCLCEVAARKGIFCHGFERLSDRDLRRRFWWIARKRPNATRAQLDDAISAYYLGRREVTGEAICCDVETREHAGCDGWNQFDNVALEGFVHELLGRRVSVG